MIQNGVKQIRKDHRNYSAHRTFGATLVFTDEYNVDAGLTIPNQNTDGYPNGCTGYSQAELCQDQDKKQYRPDFTYKKTLLMDNEQLGEPCDIRTSLKSTKVYGVLGVDESTDLEAAKHLRGAYYQVENHSDWFDSIRSTITLNKSSVSVATQWFASFGRVGQDGIISETFSPDFSWHNYKVCGWKQINGQPYLIVKSWQGSGYGDGGYCYMSRNIINRLLSVSGSGAFIVAQYDPSKIQTVKLDILSTILSYLVRLLSSFKKPTVVPAKEEVVLPQPILAKKSLVEDFCLAIRDYEGKPGDLNYRNNNPGNIRSRSGQFLKFKTYNEGFAYLKDYVTRACTGKHLSYKPEFTITKFFLVYSPTLDKNDPIKYATWVAEKLNIPVTTKIQDLL